VQLQVQSLVTSGEIHGQQSGTGVHFSVSLTSPANHHSTTAHAHLSHPMKGAIALTRQVPKMLTACDRTQQYYFFQRHIATIINMNYIYKYKDKSKHSQFITTDTTVKSSIFWDIMPCNILYVG
jgi:hypothetical protein